MRWMKLRGVQDQDARSQGLRRPRRVLGESVPERRRVHQPRAVLPVRLSGRLLWRELPVPATGTDRPAVDGRPGRHPGLPAGHSQ